jgi:hypothetical protein
MSAMPPLVSPAEDPRAVASIRRTKAWCGLAAFGLAALAAHLHGDTFDSLLTHALIAGVVGHMLGWLVATTVWRRLMRAETKRAIEQIAARRAEQAES